MSPDVNNCKKLERVRAHLWSTIFLPLTLGWNGTGNIYWGVDASFTVYRDISLHTSEVMLFDRCIKFCVIPFENSCECSNYFLRIKEVTLRLSCVQD